jgi:uncharacterized protein (TIGR03083 family)
MHEDSARAGELARTARLSTQRLLAALREMDDGDFAAPSQLPGWDRLTIVCHLRYGCRAMLRMTRDATSGRDTAYYPEGRDAQRPATLRPSPGERPTDVLDDWASAAADLDREWAAVDSDGWRTDVVESLDNPDLGTIPLARLALARLTEVDVHGTDLGIGVGDWNPTLIEVALPVRLRWLSTRRTNHRSFDRTLRGSWLLESTDGLRWLVAVNRDSVESRPALDDDIALATIRGSNRDLLALLLGRPQRQPLATSGNIAFAHTFEKAFPGP